MCVYGLITEGGFDLTLTNFLGLIKWKKGWRKEGRRKGDKEAATQCCVAARYIPSPVFTSIHTVNKSMEASTLGI